MDNLAYIFMFGLLGLLCFPVLFFAAFHWLKLEHLDDTKDTFTTICQRAKRKLQLMMKSTRVWIIIVSFLLTIGIVFVYLLIFHFSNTSDRLSFSQLLVEIIGATALFFAIWEFRRLQKKPNLDLLVQPVNGENLNNNPQKEILIYRDGKFPRGGDYEFSHEYKFKLILRNTGNIPARWVKFRLDVAEIDYRSFVGRESTDNQPPIGVAIRETTTYDIGNFKHVEGGIIFIGGDDLIVYPDPDLGSLCEIRFYVYLRDTVVQHTGKSKAGQVKFSYSIHAAEFSKKYDDDLVINLWIPPDPPNG